MIRMFYCTATHSNATFLIRGTRLFSNNRYLMWEKGEQTLPNYAAMETRLTSTLCCFSLAWVCFHPSWEESYLWLKWEQSETFSFSLYFQGSDPWREKSGISCTENGVNSNTRTMAFSGSYPVTFKPTQTFKLGWQVITVLIIVLLA